MQGRVIEKSGSVVAGTTVTAGVSVGTELWLTWAHIAIEQAQIARVARSAIVGQVDAGEQPDLNTELHPALIAIAGVATSMDGFAREVEKTGVPIKTPSVQQPTRAHWIWET